MPNKRKIVNLLDILIFFKEKVGILLIKSTETISTKWGANFLMSISNLNSDNS